MSLQGVENITMPSFDRAGRALDEDGIRFDVRHAIDQGFTATLLALNTGLDVHEMKRFVDVAVAEAGDRLQVGVELPTDSFATARELLEHAEQAGASHAVPGIPMTFMPAGDDEVYEALAPLVADTKVRIVLPVGEIGLPPQIGGGVPWGAYARLAAEPSVVAATITTWMPQVAFAALQMFRGRLAVGIGTPALLGALPLLHREYGVQWLSAAHWELWQSPERRYVVEQLDRVIAGDKEGALDIHWRLAPARGIAFGAGLLETTLDGMPHWPLAKYISWSVGGNGGALREPALRLKPHMIEARSAMLRSIGIEPAAGGDADFMAGRAGAGLS